MLYFLLILLGFAVAGIALDFGDDQPDDPHSM